MNLIWSEYTHGWWVPASTSFQESLLCPWARRCGRIGKWHDVHIYRPRRFQWTWIHPWLVNSGIRKFPGVLVMPMGMPMWADRQMTWRCTSTGQDGSNELDLEWICPLLAEFQRPHKELDLEWICPLFAEFQRPQGSRNVYHVWAHSNP